MKKTITLILLGIFSVITISSFSSFADHGYNEKREDHDSDDQGLDDRWFQAMPDIDTPQSGQYLSECGVCHFAYQPGLLPQSAWVRIMGALENHFGDDASLGQQQTTEIQNYLFRYAADFSSSSRSRAFAAGATPSSQALPRITHSRYFRQEHAELPNRLVNDNPDVVSFSNCQACHRTADSGFYGEHQVNIPGVGRWED